MAETYKIKAVNPKTKEWSSQYGPMVTYVVMFEGRDTPVEINKKQDSAAPKAGDEVYGDINRTEYGDKFKSQAKPFGGGSSGGGKSFGKPQDQFTMFLSYAKDIAVAMLDKDGKLDEPKYGAVLSAVADGGKTLYEARPDAEAKTEKVASADVTDKELSKTIDEVFGGEDDLWPNPN